MQRLMAKDRNQTSFSDALVEAAVDAIITIDSEGVVQSFNPAAERIFGYKADEVIGKSVNMLMSEPHRSKHDGYIKRYLETNEAKIIGIGRKEEGLCKDGSTFPMHLAVNEFQVDGDSLFVGILSDITERERDKKRLATQYKTSKALAEAGTVEEAATNYVKAICEEMGWRLGIIWGVDRDQEVLRCVGEWHKLADLDEFEKRTRELTLKPGEGFPGRAWASAEPIWAGDVTDEPSHPRTLLAGELGLHRAYFSPINSEGEVIGVAEFLTGEGEELDEDLVQVMDATGNQLGQFIARKHAEGEADRLKNEFFALVSHELKTPLTSIVGYLERIGGESDGKNALSDEQRKFLSVIERNTVRLQRLVGDLLFVAQVQAGKLPLRSEPVDLNSVVSRSVEAAEALASGAGIDLQYEAKPTPGIEGDADRLGQVLDNLISNAIKFTPAGGSIHVRMSIHGENVQIQVQDTGPGIPEDEHERLFDRFFRASSAVEGSVPGVGLGLSIVKAIVEGHNGHVRVSSKAGEGTTFYIELPLDARR